ncbi:hypothetical protein J4212_00685 [Candidatus Woesearchaeota archaeon]|nr:hypothetical protein [Candidatus Woesearchaeota archaeon]
MFKKVLVSKIVSKIVALGYHELLEQGKAEFAGDFAAFFNEREMAKKAYEKAAKGALNIKFVLPGANIAEANRLYSKIEALKISA